MRELPATLRAFAAEVDALAWSAGNYSAADAAALGRLPLARVCELTLAARVREHNTLALDIWRANNPGPTAR